MTFSDLVGSIAEPTDSKHSALSHGEWVEVTDARQHAQRTLQRGYAPWGAAEGAQLRVTSRDGERIEVVDPNTSREGWVYQKFVKPITPTSRQTDLVIDSSG